MIPDLIEELFHSLKGEWTLERGIYSFEGEALGSFSGKASYKEISPSLLHYREEGLLRSLGCESCAFREYYFHYNKDLSIYFDARLERLFYALEFVKEGSLL